MSNKMILGRVKIITLLFKKEVSMQTFPQKTLTKQMGRKCTHKHEQLILEKTKITL